MQSDAGAGGEGADASIARSGETLRQGEWRDELLRAGIRGRAGQQTRFARLEPLPGCRWLHADGEKTPPLSPPLAGGMQGGERIASGGDERRGAHRQRGG